MMKTLDTLPFLYLVNAVCFLNNLASLIKRGKGLTRDKASVKSCKIYVIGFDFSNKQITFLNPGEHYIAHTKDKIYQN